MTINIEAIFFNKKDGGITAIHPLSGRPVEVRYFDAETGEPLSDVKWINGVKTRLSFRNAKFSKGRKSKMGNFKQIIKGAQYV